jgi:hypothetical protein
MMNSFAASYFCKLNDSGPHITSREGPIASDSENFIGAFFSLLVNHQVDAKLTNADSDEATKCQ